jgi:hypothetical protein
MKQKSLVHQITPMPEGTFIAPWSRISPVWDRLSLMAQLYGRRTERASEIVRLIDNDCWPDCPSTSVMTRLCDAFERNRRGYGPSRFTTWAWTIGLGGKAEIMEHLGKP